MRYFKATLRALIAIGSTFGFLGSWALLAHSLKPAQPKAAVSGQTVSAIAAMPTLAPLPDLNIPQSQGAAQTQQTLLPVIVQPQYQPAMPVFTTTGS